MPKLSFRKRAEIQVAGAVLDVFRHASKYLTQGIAAVNSAMRRALRKFVGPVLQDIGRRAAHVFLVFLWGDKRAKPVVDPYVTPGTPEYDSIRKHAKRRVGRRVDDLGDEMSETNRKRWDSRFGEEGPEDSDDAEGLDQWARDTMFNAGRAISVAVTETTSAVSIAERAVADRMERLGIVAASVWVTAKDDRVCPICGPLDGLGERAWQADFPVGPPAHIRCRCYLRWMLGAE